jgi:hypothetical protein
MPPRARAIAPTPDKAAMSAPVMASGFVVATTGTGAALVTVMVVNAKPPAEMVYVPGAVFDGIVTVIEKHPDESVVVVAKTTEVLACSVMVIDSFAGRLQPLTVNATPETTVDELVVT